MKRFFEIIDGENTNLLTSNDLPFAVSMSNNENKKSNKRKTKIQILDNNNSNDINNLFKCAYIAEDDGHLFIQPEKSDVEIFHNDELIEKSVWIKSGDVIQIEDNNLIFKISGDRIEIRIVNKAEKIELISPPLSTTEHLKKEKNNNLELKIKKDPDIKKKDSTKKKHLVILMLIILTSIASFILLAETVSIKIEPEADKLQLDGLLPTIKIGERYIVMKGKYHLKANKKGYKILQETLDINSTNKQFSYTMKEKPGIVEFNISPIIDNKIFINEILLGDNSAQNDNYEIEKGIHRLKIINPRYKILEQNIKIEGKSLFQKFNLELEPNWGMLNILSIPDKALIKIKSETLDKTKDYQNIVYTPAEVELISGDYEVILTKEKFKSKKQKISIKAGESLVLEAIELEPEDGILTIKSIPDKCIIRIDGKYFGVTPQSIKLLPFVNHQIEVSLSGYEKKQLNISLEPEELQTLDIDLKSRNGVIYISSSPKQAKLYIDNKLQSRSSGKFIVTEKNHIITVRAKGYVTKTKTISASSYSKNISLFLEKISTAKVPNNQVIINSNSNSNFNSNSKPKSKYRNSLGQNMILLNPDTFKMGSTKNEIGRRSNEKEHRVKLTRSFYLSEKEVSNKEFKQFMPTHNSGMSSGHSLNTANQPVVHISWDQAAKFANWLSKKEGLKPFYKEVKGKMLAIDLKGNNKGYRLPFEAEWSYAARGKNKMKYPWYGKFPPAANSGNYADESAQSQASMIISGYNDRNIVSAATGSYQKNQFGFFDMGGNVSEWCQDYYAPYSNLNILDVDPTGPLHGTHKVVRDSSWKDASITELRLSYRNYNKKSANDIGFRVARYAE